MLLGAAAAPADPFGTGPLESFPNPYALSSLNPASAPASPLIVGGEVVGWAPSPMTLPHVPGSFGQPTLQHSQAAAAHPSYAPASFFTQQVTTGAPWAAARLPATGTSCSPLLEPAACAGMVPLSALNTSSQLASVGLPAGSPALKTPTHLPTLNTFVPVPTAGGMLAPDSPCSALHSHRSAGHSAGSTPTASSSAISALVDAAGVPRVASTPNIHFALAGTTAAAAAGTAATSGHEATSPAHRLRRPGGSAGATGTRAAAGSSVVQRSRSTNDLADLSTRYAVPHGKYLTPPHLRKGKGGRQPAKDPRLDPSIDPRKARRILANRLSAAKSKLKQKSQTQASRQRMEMLKLQEEQLTSQLESYSRACAQQDQERTALQAQVKALEQAAAAAAQQGAYLQQQQQQQQGALFVQGPAAAGCSSQAEQVPVSAAAILAAPIKQMPNDFLAAI